MTDNQINLGGAGGQTPGAHGEDGASIGGGVGGKGGLGSDQNDEVPAETLALLALASEMRRLAGEDGNATVEVEYDLTTGVARANLGSGGES